MAGGDAAAAGIAAAGVVTVVVVEQNYTMVETGTTNVRTDGSFAEPARNIVRSLGLPAWCGCVCVCVSQTPVRESLKQ